jgi:hypothetical protein
MSATLPYSRLSAESEVLVVSPREMEQKCGMNENQNENGAEKFWLLYRFLGICQKNECAGKGACRPLMKGILLAHPF